MFILTVTCTQRDFNAYWYTQGRLMADEPTGRTNSYGDSLYTFVVDYGDDQYRAEYQAGRFGSGLIPAYVTEMGTYDSHPQLSANWEDF